MKTRFFWACVISLACVPLANAYNHNDAREALRTTIDGINTRLDDLRSCTDKNNARINDLHASTTKSDNVLSNRIEVLQASVNELQAKVDSLWEKGATDLETIGRKGDKTDIKANVALWITIPIVMVICSILCFAFWPRKSKSLAISSARSDQNKCPRCGWEHDPDDTVCRNPNCRTQF